MPEQAGGAAATAAATGYTLVVPEDWFSIELGEGQAERGIRALVNRQFKGIDNAPHLKAQARRQLLDQAEAAAKQGGVEMFLSLMQIAGVPIAASLTTFVIPPPPGAESPDELAPTLGEGGDTVSVVDLPAGRAVRIVRDTPIPADLAAPGDPEYSDQRTSREVQVFIPVLGGPAWLLLAFSAPLAPLAEAMTGLFDAVSKTLRWSNSDHNGVDHDGVPQEGAV